MARTARWALVALVAAALVPSAVSAQAYTPDQLSEMPKIKSPTQAKQMIARAYPRAMQDMGVGGKVQIRFVVKADGSVDASSIEVVAASVKALGEAAAKAVRDIKFLPGKRQGTAVDAVVVMPIAFGT